MPITDIVCAAAVAGALADRFLGHGREPLSSALPRRIISFFATALYRGDDSEDRKKYKGLLLVILVTSVFTGITAAALLLAGRAGVMILPARFSMLPKLLLSAFIFYLTISAGTIRRTAVRINEALRKNGFNEVKAERAVRDLAGSLSSKIIAPLFFMILGGPALAVFYKTADTLRDYTAGSGRFRSFSGASWFLSEYLEFIPSRIAALIMLEACFFLKLDTKNALKVYSGYRKKAKGLNDGQTVSIAAGALGIRFTEDGPAIGERIWNVSPEDVLRISRLCDLTEFLSLILFCSVRLLILS